MTSFLRHLRSAKTISVSVSMAITALVVTVLNTIMPASASAQTQRVSAREARLGGLTAAELDTLKPYLDRGPLLIAEFSNAQTDLPAIIWATRVNAPADVVADVVSEPSQYPQFMPALDSVTVEARHRQQIAYRWTWQAAIFTLRGNNVLTRYRGSPTRGHRVDIRTTGGDLGAGRMVWRIRPDGPNRSILVFSSRVDMRKANYVAAQLSNSTKGINRSINIALSSVMLLGPKTEAERRAGNPEPTPAASRPLTRPNIDMDALKRFFSRGDMVFLDLQGTRLHQVAAAGRLPTRDDQRVRALMHNPNEFTSALLPGSSATILEHTEAHIRFHWDVPLPFIRANGTMRIYDIGATVALDGESGNMSEGRFRFDTHSFQNRFIGAISWSQFDPADSARLIRRIIAGNAYFGHGLAAATQLMAIRSLRSRTRRRPNTSTTNTASTTTNP